MDVDARAEQAHLLNPKSSNSSLISISFPELSFAFAMLKVARMDVKVSHNCSDGVSPTPRNLMSTNGCACNMLSNTTSVLSWEQIYIGKRKKVPPPESVRQYPVVIVEFSVFVKKSFGFEGKRLRVYAFVVCHGPLCKIASVLTEKMGEKD